MARGCGSGPEQVVWENLKRLGKSPTWLAGLKVSNHVAGRHGDMSGALDGLCDFTLWRVHLLTGFHVRRR